MLESELLNSFVIGSTSGGISAVLFQPLDVLKTRLQITPKLTNGIGISYCFVIKRIYRTDGIRGFWKGLTPGLIRCVPGFGLYFSLLHFLSKNVASEDPSALETFLVGAVARTVAATCFVPVTVLKTRFESGEYGYTGLLRAVKSIRETEGARGFFRGLVPTIIRDVPFSGIYYLIYTRTKIFMGVDSIESHSSIKVFFCGITAGCIASLITQPADIVKTYAQIYPLEFSRTTVGLHFIFQKYGIKGYFIGALMRIVRRTLMTAMSWTLYEQIFKWIHLK